MHPKYCKRSNGGQVVLESNLFEAARKWDTAAVLNGCRLCLLNQNHCGQVRCLLTIVLAVGNYETTRLQITCYILVFMKIL